MAWVVRDKTLIIVLLVLQVLFWHGIRPLGSSVDEENYTIWPGTRALLPNLGIVPEVPSDVMVDATTFGDTQLYFRIFGYQIQNAGDSFGRSTPLRDYDYGKLYQWWLIFDGLDSVSDFIPSLVSYYYSATQDRPKHIPYVVDYLEQHADRNPQEKWWWYSQAVYHAKHKLKDNDRALEIAYKMAEKLKDRRDVPIWTHQMPAFILEDKGEYKEACEIILNILESYKREELKQGEINFMMHFINDRIAAMIEADKNAPLDINPLCRNLIEYKKQE